MGCARGGLGYVLGVPSWKHHRIIGSFYIKSSQSLTLPSFSSFNNLLSTFVCFKTRKQLGNGCSMKCQKSLSPLFALPDADGKNFESVTETKDDEDVKEEKQELEWKVKLKLLSGNVGNSGILPSCLVGLLTGVAVVLFNVLVHEIRDLLWDGIPSRGASWLREEPIEATWTRVILVPAFGGVIVAVLSLLGSALEERDSDSALGTSAAYLKSALRPFLKALAACVTLGTGNSLGPEGPSVDIGTSIAKGVGSLFENISGRMFSLRAAGSAAGLSSGFNAAVAGCFFAVESVLWPSPTDASLSLTNTTSMVILSSVIAAVISEIGLGSEPAFKVPDYDFRSPGELPLYLLLGILCGLVSLALSWCTSYMLVVVDNLHKTTGVPRGLFPILGGLSVGLIALAYPEILYWGFQNVDILLESRPFVKSLSADLLLQLVAVKIVATSLCRASGLVGGYYAPSLFIGAATGMAYGKFIGFAVAESNPTIFHLSLLEVASPQAYGLVGMAATLAGVCQVPLTAVLLLFELTQDYRIVLPLLGAVGLSSWISSVQIKRGDGRGAKKLKVQNSSSTVLTQMSSSSSMESSTDYAGANSVPFSSDLCEVESSLCVDDDDFDTACLRRSFVSEAMKTKYVKISMHTQLTEVVNLMLAEKQSCAIIVDTDNTLIGLLTLRDIQAYGKLAKVKSKKPKELLVSELCLLYGGICRVPWTATPDMDLLSAQMTMKKYRVNQVPVVRHLCERAHPVGILDSDTISLTCRALATREFLK